MASLKFPTGISIDKWKERARNRSRDNGTLYTKELVSVAEENAIVAGSHDEILKWVRIYNDYALSKNINISYYNYEKLSKIRELKNNVLVGWYDNESKSLIFEYCDIVPCRECQHYNKGKIIKEFASDCAYCHSNGYIRWASETLNENLLTPVMKRRLEIQRRKPTPWDIVKQMYPDNVTYMSEIADNAVNQLVIENPNIYYEGFEINEDELVHEIYDSPYYK